MERIETYKANVKKGVRQNSKEGEYWEFGELWLLNDRRERKSRSERRGGGGNLSQSEKRSIQKRVIRKAFLVRMAG